MGMPELEIYSMIGAEGFARLSKPKWMALRACGNN